MATIKLYDRDAYATSFEAKVLSCVKQEVVNTHGDTGVVYEVILDQTLFFPEEGGQTSDKGTLGGAEVFYVQIKNDVITHILTEPLEEGAMVKGEIDWQHRFYNMQQHSGEHLFSGLAYKKYGYRNVGFHLSNQIVTMDFDGVFTEEQLLEMEWAINEAIVANVEIKTSYPAKEELANLEYRSKIEIDGPVRIVEIDGYDMCACCAPHVHRTGEIGIFKIQSVQNYKGGVRISFLCGFRALEEYRKKSQIISELSGILTTNQDLLAENVSKLKAQTQSLKSQLVNAKQIIMENKIENIPAEQKDVLLFETDLDTSVMRNVVNKLVEKHEGICGVFVGSDTEGYRYILGSKTIDCRVIATKMRIKLGAKGGGSAKMIQGSVQASEEQMLGIIR
ncbi:MAG: alanyl-tRNA editing protein [Agathobacter sp.]|nr:alanyl-tRNA editing protein [Agathobacter sp.]